MNPEPNSAFRAATFLASNGRATWQLVRNTENRRIELVPRLSKCFSNVGMSPIIFISANDLARYEIQGIAELFYFAGCFLEA